MADTVQSLATVLAGPVQAARPGATLRAAQPSAALAGQDQPEAYRLDPQGQDQPAPARTASDSEPQQQDITRAPKGERINASSKPRHQGKHTKPTTAGREDFLAALARQLGQKPQMQEAPLQPQDTGLSVGEQADAAADPAHAVALAGQVGKMVAAQNGQAGATAKPQADTTMNSQADTTMNPQADAAIESQAGEAIKSQADAAIPQADAATLPQPQAETTLSLRAAMPEPPAEATAGSQETVASSGQQATPAEAAQVAPDKPQPSQLPTRQAEPAQSKPSVFQLSADAPATDSAQRGPARPQGSAPLQSQVVQGRHEAIQTTTAEQQQGQTQQQAQARPQGQPAMQGQATVIQGSAQPQQDQTQTQEAISAAFAGQVHGVWRPSALAQPVQDGIKAEGADLTQLGQAAANVQAAPAGASASVQSPLDPQALRSDGPSPYGRSLADQVAEGIRAGNRGTDQVVIRLNPPDLGRLRLTFQSQDGQVLGVIRVQNSQTLAQLQREMPVVLQQLADSGIHLRRLDVLPDSSGLQQHSSSLYDGQQRQQWQEQQQTWQGPRGEQFVGQGLTQQTYASRHAGWAGEGSLNVWL